MEFIRIEEAIKMLHYICKERKLQIYNPLKLWRTITDDFVKSGKV